MLKKQLRKLFLMWVTPASLFVIGVMGMAANNSLKYNSLAANGVESEVVAQRDGRETLTAGKGNCPRMSASRPPETQSPAKWFFCEDTRSGVIDGATIVITWNPQDPSHFVVGKTKSRSVITEVATVGLIAFLGTLVLLLFGAVGIAVIRKNVF